ncbi:MAG: tryptophan synthase subunit alpha [Planctomycetaceae bacterium]|nr:tryptophan synthase subunit alpha [Planctomycetaceae bacterium]
MAFMPFITCGDPDMQTTAAVIRTLAESGVDLIELGFPYSDPIADGPVIQASYTRALDHHLKVRDIFATVGELETDSLPPLVAMVAWAIVFRTGPEKFAAEAARAGFSGLIIPDLPGDEATEAYQLLQSHGLDLIQLVAPTTTDARTTRILNSASGFLYCISVAGTTGVRDELPPELRTQLEHLRSQTDLPLAVGFGISQPAQLDLLRGAAQGAIVGSAIVRMFEQLADGTGNKEQMLAEIGRYAKDMSTAAHTAAERSA